MSKQQIHFDLRRNLHAKIRRAVSDHLQLCEVAEISGADAAAGLGDVLMHLAACFFVDLDFSPQEFAKLSIKVFKDRQGEIRDEAEAARHRGD